MRFFVVFCILISLSHFSFSQDWTLDKCLDYAFSHRIELKKQKNALSYYESSFKYSKYELLPSVAGEMNYGFTGNKQYDTEKGTYDKNNNQAGALTLSSNIVLFDGFQTINKIKQSKILIARNKTYTESIRNTIKLEVLQVYFEVLSAKENIRISEASISSTQEQINFIKIAVEEGRTSEIDLLEVKAQLEKEKSYFIDATKQYEQSVIKLKKAINFTDTAVFELNNLLISTLIEKEVDINSIYLQAITLLPEFKMAEYDSLYWNYAIKQIKGQYQPYLTGNGYISSSYNKNAVNYSVPNETYKLNNQLDNNFNHGLGVSLIIPIYSKHRIKSQLIEKEQQLNDINLEKEQLYKDIYFEIEQICKETRKKQENIQTIEKCLEYYSKIYEMRTEQYKHGVISIIDLLIADTNKKNTELQLSFAKYSLLYSLKIIEFYSGKI